MRLKVRYDSQGECGKMMTASPPGVLERLQRGHLGVIQMQPQPTTPMPTCAQCGVPFDPDYGKRRRYCSRACFIDAVRLDESAIWKQIDKNGPIPDYRPDLGPCWIWQG